MKRATVAVLLSGFFALLTLGLAGCSNSSHPVAVTLTPSGTKSIDQAQTVAITAAVAYDSKNAGVSWTVTGGTLTNTTTTSATFNAPATVTSPTSASVTATSITDTTKFSTLAITVNPPPAITTTSLTTQPTAGTAYSATLAETGGTSPFTWSVTPTTLPAGLSLNASTGVISGTPTGGGSGTFTFTVTDAAGVASTTQALAITVGAAPALTITTTSLPGATVGTPYTATMAATGGVPSYTWSITSGPSWLVINPSTGALSGTPNETSASTAPVTVTVTDSGTPTHATANSAGLSIVISITPLQITTTSLPGATVGTPYSASVAATGGIPSYKWSIVTGPSWLTINSSTGALSGTPNETSAGTVPVTVQVQDAETPPVTVNSTGLSIVISITPLTITTTSLPSATVNAAYSATVNASGGITPYKNWTLIGAPSWLSINSSTGQLTGTAPATPGTTPSFTVQVTDSESPAVTVTSADLTITINAASACTGTLNNSLLSGNYAFMLNGWSSSTTATSTVGSFVATPGSGATGTISGGIIDIADQNTSAPVLNATFTGTYCVGSNNLAIITINPTGGSSATVAAALDASDGNGHVFEYDTSGKLISGLLRKQTTSAFTTGSITGNYAFGFVGAYNNSPPYSLAMAGYFNSDGGGGLNGVYDMDVDGILCSDTPPCNISASDLTVASTGRGTVSITAGSHTTPYVFYVVSASELLIMAADTSIPPQIQAGQALKQSSGLSNSSLSGVSVLEDQYLDGGTTPTAEAGLLTVTTAGSLSGSFDQNDGGTLSTQTPSGSYSVDSSTGRVTLSGAGIGNNPPVFYLVGPNQAFMVGTGGSPDFGTLTPQTGTTFTDSSISGLYLGGSQPPVSWNVKTEVDSVTFNDSADTVTGTSDKSSDGQAQSPDSISGDYCTSASAGSSSCTSNSTGRVIVLCPSGSGNCTAGDLQEIIYIISPEQFVALDASGQNPKLTDFHQ